jgi:hypothetical protein
MSARWELSARDTAAPAGGRAAALRRSFDQCCHDGASGAGQSVILVRGRALLRVLPVCRPGGDMRGHAR